MPSLGERIHDGLACLGAQRGVEPGERLVEQHDARARRERSGEGDPALLAARELVRAPARVVALQPDEVERLADPRGGLALGAGEAEGDVLGDA